MTPDPNKTYWWAYVHANHTLQLKRWYGDVKDYTEDCKDNPFVEFVIEPFEANSREEAFIIANQKVLDRQIKAQQKKCDNWTKCPHAKCLREAMSGEKWACKVCGESWTVDYDEIR